MLVATRGSFTLAAKELFMAQSTATRRVAALEAELGIQLLHRTPVVAVTGAGAAFLPEAQLVLDAVDRAIVAARAAGSRSDAA